MQASQAVLEHAGGAWDASLNHYDTGGGCMVTTQQVDEWVYVVGQDDFAVGRYTLDEWLGTSEQTEPQLIEADDATQAWELLRLMRQDALVWQCGACDGWIFTSNRPASASFSAQHAVTAASISGTPTGQSEMARTDRKQPPSTPSRRRDMMRTPPSGPAGIDVDGPNNKLDGRRVLSRLTLRTWVP